MRKDPAFVKELTDVSGGKQVKFVYPQGDVASIGFARIRGSVAGDDPDPAIMIEGPDGKHVPSGSSSARYEEQAVDYTDAFMHKNFGQTAHRRGYGNTSAPSLAEGQQPKPPATEPEPLTKPLLSGLPRYTPEEAPVGENLPSPPIIRDAPTPEGARGRQ
ncbi:MAG: hypothetical protein ACOYJ2_08795 [Rickettsiales bacterium]